MRDTWRTISGWQDEIRASKDRFGEYATGEFDAYSRVLRLIGQDHPCFDCSGTGLKDPGQKTRINPVQHRTLGCENCDGTGVCDA